ncbi:MAG: hypothetical protein KatS3mg057_1509 [Herpetosiphonaceae bacterium]|nr:MAG: hypothetical protein KatS3mg057_1509 [Herpetosiphonaceae bacterium]
MEIEAKFAITGPLDSAALAAVDLGPYRLAAPRQQIYRDLLLDTPGRVITGSGHALRLRFVEDGAILTFKGPGRRSGSIHEREELEEWLPLGAENDRGRWPPVIAGRVRALAGDEPLTPIISLELRRQTWAVERGGDVVGELALDEGMIRAGGAAESVHELEIEIKGDLERQELDWLGRRLCEQLPLQPEPRTKLQRGLALLQGRDASGDE